MRGTGEGLGRGVVVVGLVGNERVFPAEKAGVYFISFDYRVSNCKESYAPFIANSELIELTLDLV